MSPDMNPIEHVWDFIGRKINQHNPKCQNIDELRTAILQEWQQFPQERRDYDVAKIGFKTGAGKT
jgi:transposase